MYQQLIHTYTTIICESLAHINFSVKNLLYFSIDNAHLILKPVQAFTFTFTFTSLKGINYLPLCFIHLLTGVHTFL
jgi:hypothetical protein